MTAANLAYLDAARHCLNRTVWDFSEEERTYRHLVIDALDAIRKAERLIELSKKNAAA